MGRSPCCDENGLKKGPWTPEEDHKLVLYIQKHGHGSWRALPKLAGLNRCGKSCRLRWTNYLRPDIKRGKFSPEEEQSILNLHSILGNKWSAIATHLPGRTDNEIKNFWNTHLKKKLIQMGFDPMTHRPRTDFFAALPHLLALANLVDHRPSTWLVDGLSAEAAKLQCLQYILHSATPPSADNSINNLLNSTDHQSFLSSFDSMNNNQPLFNTHSTEIEFPLSYEQPLMSNENSSFSLFTQGETSTPISVLPPLTDMSNPGDACSTSSCGGSAAASFWPDLLLDDPFMAEFV
ncbi:hypothetical protein KFK09_020034 [Dendrobium nobile]|uniref:Uncharacterized protein n=1 Tax=Dendrobium nobile TaxID=94219 RepID=A0A8T3ARR5_DENNO|nr:hypothetical protein KFK09_020034 [Dendrobium nobile]